VQLEERDGSLKVYGSPVEITSTLELLCKYWEAAEKELQDEVRDVAPNLGEEDITSRFHTHVAALLDKANDRGEFSEAFLEDLRYAAPAADPYDLRLKFEGLSATVRLHLHARHDEGQTGGDLGLVVVRPFATADSEAVRVQAGYRRGMLGQAKLRVGSGWGTFTKPQRRALRDRTAYLALLLYSYADVPRRRLRDFQWQLGAGNDLPTIEGWLRTDSFPSLRDSRAIVTGLGTDRLGTDDPGAIDGVILPEGGRYLELRLDWPDHRRPKGEVVVESVPRHERQQLTVRHV
jgi:hypothetical protein